jgi:hypothetical protein
MLIGTAIRVLPKVIGLKLCEMGAKSINVNWNALYEYVRQTEPYIQNECNFDTINVNSMKRSYKKTENTTSRGKRSVKFVD